MIENEAHFSQPLLDWYKQNHRDLPWRNTSDPYHIWLSEIILQQTRVEQGLPYFEHFISQYPTIKDLAGASSQQVMKSWEGLGYYSRARNLHFTANYIHSELEGKFPNNYKDLLKLKGIGPYTGAAIASFAFKERIAAVDGNVYRILSRVFNISTPIDSTEGKKEFQELAQTLISKEHPDLFNQATMELGATVCHVKKPNCDECPLSSICEANAQGNYSEFPVKSKKLKKTNRTLEYLAFEHKGEYLIHKRTDKDIWQDLYQFLLLQEQNSFQQTEDILKSIKEYNEAFTLISSNDYKRILSHQNLSIRVHQVELKDKFELENHIWVPQQELKEYGFPKSLEIFISENII